MFAAFNPKWGQIKAASRHSAQTTTRKSQTARQADQKPIPNDKKRKDKTLSIPLQDLSHLRPEGRAENAANDVAPRPPPLSGSSSSSRGSSSSSRRSSSTASMVSAKTHFDSDSVVSSRCSEVTGGGTDVIDFGDLAQVVEGWYRSRGLPLPSQEAVDSKIKITTAVRKRELEDWQKYQDDEADKRRLAKQIAAKQRQTERQGRMHLGRVA